MCLILENTENTPVNLQSTSYESDSEENLTLSSCVKRAGHSSNSSTKSHCIEVEASK